MYNLYNIHEPLPALSFGIIPSLNFSEICYLLIGDRKTDPIENLNDAEEWQLRLDNETQDDNSIRLIKVIGEMQAPKKTEKKISGNRSIPVLVERTISFTIDDTNSLNYDFARMAGIRNGIAVKAWYVTTGGKLYGGSTGINAVINIESILNKGKDEIEIYSGTLTWYGYALPDFTPNPIKLCVPPLLWIDSDEEVIVDEDDETIIVNNGN